MQSREELASVQDCPFLPTASMSWFRIGSRLEQEREFMYNKHHDHCEERLVCLKLGFIGAGNMGSAIIKGILNHACMEAQNLYVSRKHPELSSDLARAGVHIMHSNAELVRAVDCVVLAVKPVYLRQVLNEIRDTLDDKFVISIVAGWNYDMLKEALPDRARFLCVMPNTPLAVGEGMSLINNRYTCTEDEFLFAKRIFEASGKVAVVDEHVFTPAVGISGCGPAFVYAFIEALADGGVRYGVPRALAYELAAQTLIGASRMVLETGEHPGKLKDNVCSPGGTTIEGIYALEKGGMRSAVMEAVGSTVEKTRKLAGE